MIYFEPSYKQKLSTVKTDQNAYSATGKTDDISLDMQKHRPCEFRFTSHIAIMEAQQVRFRADPSLLSALLPFVILKFILL